MCGPTCAAPEDVDMTCDGCVAGIQVTLVQKRHFRFFFSFYNLFLGESSDVNNDFHFGFI